MGSFNPFGGDDDEETIVSLGGLIPDPRSHTDVLLRELIDEVRGLRADLKIQEIRSGKRLIGQ